MPQPFVPLAESEHSGSRSIEGCDAASKRLLEFREEAVMTVASSVLCVL